MSHFNPLFHKWILLLKTNLYSTFITSPSVPASLKILKPKCLESILASILISDIYICTLFFFLLSNTIIKIRLWYYSIFKTCKTFRCAQSNCNSREVGQSVQSLSRVWLFATPWTVAYQAPLSIEGKSKEEGNLHNGVWSLGLWTADVTQTGILVLAPPLTNPKSL